MATPIITDLAAVMASYNSHPVVTITCKLQDESGDAVSVVSPSGLEYFLPEASGWASMTLHSSTTGLSMLTYASAPGRNTTLRWDITEDFTGVDASGVLIRLNVADPSGNMSGYATASGLYVKTSLPTATLDLDTYTNLRTYIFTPSTSNGAAYYRVGETASLDGIGWTTFTTTASITFASTTQEAKNVYIQMRDAYYNIGVVTSDSVIYHTAAPQNTYTKLNGSVTDVETYTGMTIGTDGSFTPNRNLVIDMYAEDALNMDIYIDGDLENGTDIRSWIPYKTTASGVLSGLDWNYDADKDVTVTFRDAAGNTSEVTKTIRLNTQVYSCAHSLLRVSSADYNHQVLEVSEVGATTIVNETVSLVDTFIRKWNEVFYPTTHRYPTTTGGTIDEAACIAMNQNSSSQYDAVQLSSGAVYYDSEHRPVTVGWTTDGSKDYGNLKSSYVANLEYWVLDNTGYGDIDLQFEYFFVDANSYGPPYNNIAPYTGDHIVIYDASAEGATQETIGAHGVVSYTLLDSSKLVELYAYTGRGNQVIELSTGYSVNANSNGGFSVPTIRGINRICIIFYSDASHTASGFKLKAGPKHSTVFRNYDVDEERGEIWIHKYPNGQAPTSQVRMIYDYYDTNIVVDSDAGTVTFEQDPSGVVSADYTHYVKQEDRIAEDYSRLFVATNDDFIDYLSPSVYVTPSGQNINKTATYLHGFPVPVSASGKISSYFTVDKDRGLLEFFSGQSEYGYEFGFTPSGRLTIDYFYHTYKRLCNDGFGTLLFRDSTIVADETPVYPDYTWSDVKIVNEGDAILENGRLKFVSRGFDNDNDGTIDQVLDVNRPWDVQHGTPAETYQKVAMQVAANYTFNSFCSKTEARTILGNWQNASFGFDVYPRTIFYGRVVWVLGGTGGNGYPNTTVGTKTFSAELEGRYYNIQV